MAELGLGPGFVCSEVCAVKIELRLHGEAGMTPLVVIVLEPEKGCDREISCLRPWPRLLDEEDCIGWKEMAGELIQQSLWIQWNMEAERGMKCNLKMVPIGETIWAVSIRMKIGLV